MNFKLKNKQLILYIIIGIITCFRIFFLSEFPLGVRLNQPFDQLLMLNTSKSLLESKWLGIYSHTTLVKGIFYPIFLVLAHFSGIPYYMFLTLFYIGSIIILIISLKPYLRRSYLIILYLILLFNPTSYAGNTFIEFYRNSLGISEVLLFISGVIFVYSSKFNIKKLFCSSLFLGIIITIISHTREDGIWMMPALTLLLIILFINFYKEKKYINFIFLLFIFMPLLVSNIVIRNVNYNYYNTHYINELKEGYYPKFLKSLMQIEVDDRKEQQTITLSSLKKAYEVSPTLKELENRLSRLTDKDLSNAYAMWIIRKIIYDANDFKNANQADVFFKKVYLELEEGFNTKKLKKDCKVLSIFMNRFTKNDILPIAKKFLSTPLYTTTYKDVKFYYIDMNDVLNIEEVFHSETNSDNNSQDYNKQFFVFELILTVYKVIFPVFAIFSFLIYLFSFVDILKKKKVNNIFLISTFALLSYLALIFIISYTDVVSFWAMQPYYLNPVYSLQVVFVCCMYFYGWEVYFYEKNKCCFALFKRRK